MDMGFIRGLMTLILMALFIGLWFWSWSKKRSAEFDAASRLPLGDDRHPQAGDQDKELRS
jgi:cytochrome c oxidase cbb3-type subunit 4